MALDYSLKMTLTFLIFEKFNILNKSKQNFECGPQAAVCRPLKVTKHFTSIIRFYKKLIIHQTVCDDISYLSDN